MHDMRKATHGAGACQRQLCCYSITARTACSIACIHVCTFLVRVCIAVEHVLLRLLPPTLLLRLRNRRCCCCWWLCRCWCCFCHHSRSMHHALMVRWHNFQICAQCGCVLAIIEAYNFRVPESGCVFSEYGTLWVLYFVGS